jgi:hypothetical protein
MIRWRRRGASLERIEAKLDELLARPVAAPSPVQVSHRRVADGGRRVREQRRSRAIA